MPISTADRSKNPYPIHLSKEIWDQIESCKNTLMGLPKRSDVIRCALVLGIQQMAKMGQDELAKAIRGY